MIIFRGRVIFSVFLVLLGVSLLLNNLGYEGINIRTYWPVFPLLWGVSLMLESRGRSTRDSGRARFSLAQFISGGIVTLIGAAYLARNLGYVEVDFSLLWSLFWPIIIILIGITLLKGRVMPSGSKTNWAVMGEVDKGKTSWNLKSDSYVAIMGGVNLDLSHATILPGETVLECTAIMGGIEIYVPEGVGLILDGTAILGGLEFFRESAGGIITNKRVEIGLKNNPVSIIKIQATAIMGGINVKKA